MKNFKELQSLRTKANDELGELYTKANNREFTPEEAIKEQNLMREIKNIEAQMRGITLEAEHAKANDGNGTKSACAALRERLQGIRQGKEDREITLAKVGSTKSNITDSGAINLTVHDIIPNLEEGLDLPAGLNIVTGVIGNELWPVSIDDVDIDEPDEVEAVSEKVLNFDKISPISHRLSLAVGISNRAIDNAAFDLLGFVQTKFAKAMQRFFAKKMYSPIEFDGVAGPFSGMAAGTIELGANAYKNILAKVAEFTNKGFIDGEVCLSFDKVTEAELKATPKAQGQGGFVIENGLCCGYKYTTSHWVNTELSGNSIVATADRYFEIGFWGYEALQTHDEVKLVVDATSAEVAKKGKTVIVLNTAASATDLSTKFAGSNGASQAFGRYKITTPSNSNF